MPTIKLPPLYAKQHRALYNASRYSVIEGSTKCGKTHGCLIWQIQQVFERGGIHWWVAPVYQQARIAFERAKKYLPVALYSATDQPMVITIGDHAKWEFRSGEKPDTLYGEDVQSAVIDEASRVREKSWHAVRSTLTATRGPIRVIGNVKGRGNWFYHLARKAQQRTAGYSYHKITALDAVEAGVLAREEVEDAREALPEAVFRELYLAEPADDGGNPFGLAAIEACVGPLSTAPPVAWGWDLAKSIDWTVGIALDADGAVCRLERWQRKSWDYTRRRIAELTDARALVDSTGVGDPVVEDIRRECKAQVKGFKFTPSSKQQLMEGLAVAIQSGELRYPDGVIRQELDTYEYEYTRTGVRYSAPEGLHDDAVCALALAWSAYSRRSTLPRVKGRINHHRGTRRGLHR